MAFCSNCGTKLEDSAKFCSGCGVAITAPNSQQNQQRKISYDGEILKCPNCGEVLNSFSTVCPSCGYELRGAKVSSSIQELVRKLEELEAKRDNQKESLSSFVKHFSNELSPIDKQKISLIQNFPIPNTKEDIQEFLILASSYIEMDMSIYSSAYDRNAQTAIVNAWKIKYKQAQEKARLSFGEQEFKNLKEKNQTVTGWKSWSPLKKIGWIILNIYTCGIPAILYYVVRKK